MIQLAIDIYTGSTSLSSGVTLNGGSLAGSGSISGSSGGTLIVNGGSLAPGASGVALGWGQPILSGSSSYEQLNVTGSVLQGSNLTLNAGYTPQVSDTLTIIHPNPAHLPTLVSIIYGSVGAVTKVGAGVFLVTGSTQSFTGTTSISAGTVNLTTLPSTPLNLQLSGNGSLNIAAGLDRSQMQGTITVMPDWVNTTNLGVSINGTIVPLTPGTYPLSAIVALPAN